MAKLVTCGLLIIQQKKLFLAHSTGNSFWDLPKGLQDNGETYDKTVIRETFEETGFKIHQSEIDFLGLMPYNKKKDLALFKYIGNQIFLPEKAICTSLFENFKGEMLPEVDDFKFFEKDEALKNTTQSMTKVLSNLKF